MLTIKELRARGFRGLRVGPTLNFGHGGLLLYGCNGVGKTSWVDAIEKPLTGRCSSVETGDQAVSWTKHGTHIRATEPSVVLVLTDGAKNYEVTLNTDPVTLPAPVRKLLTAAKQYGFILRRRTLLDFILAKPQDRYKAIQGFLNLDEYAAFERKLKDLKLTVDARVASAESAILRDETALRLKLLVLSNAPIDEEAIVQRVNQLLREAGLSSIENVAQLGHRSAEAEELMTTFGDVESLGRISALQQRCATLPADEPLRSAVKVWAEATDTVVNAEKGLKQTFYSEVLTKGLEWIRNDALNNCPLCDSPIDAAAVEEAVKDKLASHEHLTLLRRLLSDAKRTLDAALQQRREALRIVAQDWIAAMGGNVPEALLTMSSALDATEVSLKRASSTAELTESANAVRLDHVREHLTQTIGERKRSFPDQKRYASLFTAREAIQATSTYVPQLGSTHGKCRRLRSHSAQIHRLAELAEAARKAAVQQLVDNVAATADKYFQIIHPGEKIGKPLLNVPDRGTGSLTLTGDFYGRRSDPRGHYSEGHLDSLGLCLFLAIRRLHHTQYPDLALLVLDDVLHSVDADHRRRTAKMIVEEFRDHQILITTHDPLWFEHLKVVTRNKGFVLQRIAFWTIEDGPTLSDYVADYEWLVSSAAKGAKPADKVITAGRLLEETLQNLCHNLCVSVPFRRCGDYTIDPLWTNFVKMAKGNTEFWGVAHEYLDEIEALRMLRNLVGAHWNEWAQQLTPSEAEDFCNAVLGLRTASYCDECGGFIERIAQLDGVWSCEREHKRYQKKSNAAAASAASPAVRG